MCRLFAFRSAVPSPMHRSMLSAENAIAQQSLAHQDGWGMAYYIDRFPHLVRSPLRAVDDDLFSTLGRSISTRSVVAHIRRATVGAVKLVNCHPFQFGRWVCAHNGEISAFTEDIRSSVKGMLHDDIAPYVLGTTDSELVFFMILSELIDAGVSLSEDISSASLIDAIRYTAEKIERSFPPLEGQKPNRLNLLISNGDLLCAYRHNEDLYLSTHKSKCPERDICSAYDRAICEKPVASGRVNHFLVSSEPIHSENVWMMIKNYGFALVDQHMNLEMI